MNFNQDYEKTCVPTHVAFFIFYYCYYWNQR
jgi:hypothetical protein